MQERPSLAVEERPDVGGEYLSCHQEGGAVGAKLVEEAGEKVEGLQATTEVGGIGRCLGKHITNE